MKQLATISFVALLTGLLVAATGIPAKAQKAETDNDGKGTATSEINTISGSNLRLGSPTPPPFLSYSTDSFNKAANLPILDLATTTSTVTVSGVGPYLWDLDLVTSITHTFNSDLEITLTSPEGTVVTITTDNGGNNDNIFQATLWDDQGDIPVTDAVFIDGSPSTPLVPEEAMGAFIGEDPNGVWTLDVFDDAGLDTGTLHQWQLIVTTLPSAPVVSGPYDIAFAGPVAIPDPGEVAVAFGVAGLPSYAFDVNLTTAISHTWSSDLEITITSPAGTVVTISTDNGGSNDNVFLGTFWDDDAGDANPPGPVSDALFLNGVTETPLVPEEAMAAFIGENPNGQWTVRIRDDIGLDVGTLHSVALSIFTLDPTQGLPVELSAFSAEAAPNGDVLLRWQTASEEVNAGFEIEHARSDDEGEPAWESVDFVEGAGTTLEPQSYAYELTSLEPGTHLFRLKQVDFDGAFAYSEVVEASVTLPNSHMLGEAYPNPFNPSTSFTLLVSREQQVRVDVFDVMGHFVGTIFDGFVSANVDHRFHFDAGSIPSGTYLYRVSGENFVDGGKMILLK